MVENNASYNENDTTVCSEHLRICPQPQFTQFGRKLFYEYPIEKPTLFVLKKHSEKEVPALQTSIN